MCIKGTQRAERERANIFTLTRMNQHRPKNFIFYFFKKTTVQNYYFYCYEHDDAR